MLKNTKTKIFFLIALFLIIGLTYYFLAGKSTINDSQTLNKNAVITAAFNCSGNKTIIAEFDNGKVKLKLSDNRTIELPQAMSASGARYANKNESFVFWNKGDTAFIEENGQATFSDCLVKTE